MSGGISQLSIDVFFLNNNFCSKSCSELWLLSCVSRLINQACKSHKHVDMNHHLWLRRCFAWLTTWSPLHCHQLWSEMITRLFEARFIIFTWIIIVVSINLFFILLLSFASGFARVHYPSRTVYFFGIKFT